MKQQKPNKHKQRHKKRKTNTPPPANNVSSEVVPPKQQSLVLRIMPYLLILITSFVLYARTLPYEYVLDDKAVITNNQFTKQGIEGISDIMSADIFEGIGAKRKDYVVGGRYRPLSIVMYAIEWEYTAEYTITDQTIETLKKQRFPENTLNQIATLKDNVYKRAEYMEKLQNIPALQNSEQQKKVVIAATNIEGKPEIHHFINILLYAITGMVLYLILEKLFRSRLEAGIENFNPTPKLLSKWYLSVPFVASMLYIAHPLHTEAVASIKGRDEIMTLLGSLLTLWYSIRYFESRKLYYLAISLLVYVFAFFSKENAITFIAVIPLTIYFFGIRNKTLPKSRRVVQRSFDLKGYTTMLIPLFIGFIIYMIVRAKVLGEAAFTTNQPKDLMNNPFLYTNFWTKYATIFMTLGIYLKLLVFPHPLTFDYYPNHIEIINWADWRALVPLLVYAAMAYIAIKQLPKRTIWSYSIWFYLATFSVVSNIVFPIGAFMSERFMYISSIGFILAISYFLLVFLPQYLEKKKIPAAVSNIGIPVFILLLFTAYSVKTYARNAAWESEFTLFTTDVEISKRSAKGNYAAGFAWIQKAKETQDSTKRSTYYERGIDYLYKSLDEHPGFENVLVFLGNSHYEYNRNYKKAIEAYIRVLKLYPNYEKVYAYINSIMSFEKQMNLEYKQNVYEQLYSINPKRYDVVFGLGYLLYQQKKYKQAVPYFESATKLKPGQIDTYKLLGVCYGSSGQLNKSAQSFEQALKINPKDVQVYQNLSRVYNSLKQPAKARYYMEMAQKVAQQ